MFSFSGQSIDRGAASEVRRFLALMVCGLMPPALQGCVEPQIEAANDRGVIVKYANSSNSSTAFQIADAYCRQHGRVARANGANFVYNHLAFACVEP